jgi:hypothetical protein
MGAPAEAMPLIDAVPLSGADVPPPPPPPQAVNAVAITRETLRCFIIFLSYHSDL